MLWLLLVLGALFGGAILSESERWRTQRPLLPPPGPPSHPHRGREIELLPGNGYWATTDRAAAESFVDDLEDRVEAFIDILAPFERYDEPLYVDAFARAHRDRLLADRENIIKANAEFQADRAFVRLLKETSHTAFLRATFKVRALARAEELDVASAPNGRSGKETPAAYRARQRAHIRRQGALAVSTMEEKLRVMQRARERWTRQGVDARLREILERELMATLQSEDGDEAATERYS